MRHVMQNIHIAKPGKQSKKRKAKDAKAARKSVNKSAKKRKARAKKRVKTLRRDSKGNTYSVQMGGYGGSESCAGREIFEPGFSISNTSGIGGLSIPDSKIVIKSKKRTNHPMP
jgi:hypothetical protein